MSRINETCLLNPRTYEGNVLDLFGNLQDFLYESEDLKGNLRDRPSKSKDLYRKSCRLRRKFIRFPI